MTSAMTRVKALAGVLILGATVLVGCGNNVSTDDSKSGGFDVTTAVVSDETTQDIRVFAPDAQGPWPVVFVLHGVDGRGQDMAEMATRLAREGTVVFAPTWRTDIGSRADIEHAVSDVECGYRFVRGMAADYGGDLDQPVTFVGWSFGATAALSIGLTENIDPTGEHLSCVGNVPRPDVIVAISGCYFEYEGVQQSTFDVAGWANKDARITLLAGERDETCAAWQTQDAAARLRSTGYSVDSVILDGANHYAPVFHDVVDGQWVVRADDPPGDRTVSAILNAIASG